MSSRTTNLDAVRLIAAGAVIIGHAYGLTGRPGFYVLGLPITSLAVFVFFVTSGWLIAGSWDRSPHFVNYLRNRALRIFPALAVVIIASVLVIGPLVTTLPWDEYFTSSGTWLYLQNIFLWTNHILPGVFDLNEYPWIVNGSVWTLPMEFLCYLALPLLGRVPVRDRPGAAAAVSVLLLSAYFVIPAGMTVGFLSIQSLCLYAAFFYIGAFLRYATKGNAQAFRVDIAVFLLILWAAIGALAPAYGVLLTAIFLPYSTLAIALASTPGLRHASRWGDFSYGLYLWGFPVQQLVVHFLGIIPLGLNLLLVLVASLGLAILSWKFIERPAMMLRKVPATQPAMHAEPAAHRVSA